ncbi:MAG TPA: hypothetical protein VFQ35_00190 [Polyangiaceae bacterium]|nr:hypothetical protein [Polyangiaceae bacterium]
MRRGAGTAAPSLALCLAAFVGCSLMALDDFDAKPCVTDADCALANANYLGGRCGHYSCVAGLCTPPDGVERCGRGDEDCDGLIDEGDDLVTPVESGGAAEPVPTIAWAFARNPPSSLLVVPGDEALGVTLDEGFARIGAVQPLTFSRDGDPTPCRNHNGQSACNAEEVALAVDDEHAVFAAINTLGCAAGQVRLAIGERSDPFSLLVDKSPESLSPAESNLALGVDTDEKDRCTGASRAADAEGVVARGATRPAIAVNSTASGASGALALWLAAPRDANQSSVSGCASHDPITVEGIGVFVPLGEPPWLQGTDGGKPTSFGTTTSLSTPAVLALGESQGGGDYLVAFAGERDSRPGIVFVRAHVQGAHLSVSLDPLFIADDAPEQVTLSLAGTHAGQTEIGVAWSSGCGAGRMLRFTTRALETAASGREIAAFAAPNLASSAQLLHFDTGFATSAPTGGWALTWLDAPATGPSSVRFARIRDTTLQKLNDVTLRTGAVGVPLMFPGGDSGVRFVFVHDVNRIVSAPGWCP